MRYWLLTAAVAGVVLAGLAGCAPKAVDEAVQKANPPMGHPGHDMSKMSDKDMGKMPGMDAKTDKTAALPAGANTICPVEGDKVDPAIHVDYKGRTIYFCCKDCPAKFNKDPEKYMAI